jgi:hypothetical protein
MGLEDLGLRGPEGRARPPPPTLATTWSWRFGRASKSNGQTAVKCITVSNPWWAFFVRSMTEFFMSRGDLTQTC